MNNSYYRNTYKTANKVASNLYEAFILWTILQKLYEQAKHAIAMSADLGAYVKFIEIPHMICL